MVWGVRILDGFHKGAGPDSKLHESIILVGGLRPFSNLRSPRACGTWICGADVRWALLLDPYIFVTIIQKFPVLGGGL